ncbi:hypothetical protein B0H11DRAFT_1943622 [Mycena galericulata]|nr:hypothetical protein B0H11DRAFT_1943622 [Mycena galericulata]
MHTRTTVTLPGCRRRQYRCGHGGKADMPSKVGFGAPSPQAKITICSTSAVIKFRTRLNCVSNTEKGKKCIQGKSPPFLEDFFAKLYGRLVSVQHNPIRRHPPSRDASLNRLRRCEELFPVGGQVGVFFYEAGGRINDQRVRFQAPVVIGAISSGRAEWHLLTFPGTRFPVVPMFTPNIPGFLSSLYLFTSAFDGVSTVGDLAKAR